MSVRERVALVWLTLRGQILRFYTRPDSDAAQPSWAYAEARTWQSKLVDLERSSVVWRLLASFLVLAFAVLHLRKLFWWSKNTPYDFDAVHTYLPLAKELIAQGPAFFLTEAGIRVPPFAVVFPALFGAELEPQRQINMGLSVAIVLLLFRTGYLLHSITAGLFAAFLYAASPHFLPYVASASVEALYLFLLVVVFWALAEAWRGARWAFPVAAVTLGLATMTRATILYMLPAVALAAWWVSRRRLAAPERDFWRGVRNAHVAAGVIVAPLILKNFALWGVAAVSTGAGIALLTGHHPLVYGMESNYFNINSDHGVAAAAGLSHLDVRANASMAAFAKFVIAELPVTFLAKMYALKASAILFAINREWIMPIEALRGWRVVLLATSFLSVFAIRRIPLVAYLWLFFGLQFVLHLPALYLHRYSVPFVDLPLALLAAIGVAFAIFSLRWWVLPIWTGGVYLCWLAAMPTTLNPSYPLPNLYGVSHKVMLSYDRASLPISELIGFEKSADGVLTQVAERGTIELDFSSLPGPRVANLSLSMVAKIGAPTTSGDCVRVRLEYRAEGDKEFREDRAWSQPWQPSADFQTLMFGLASHVRVNEPGRLRLIFSCNGATVDIKKLEVVQTRTMVEFRKKFFEKEGIDSWEEWYKQHGYLRGK
jgi:hypothetical protein